MKFTLIILSVLVPFFAQAGGGGGLRPGMEMMAATNPEIVFNLGEHQDIVYYSRGRLVNNQWKIENIQMPSAGLEMESKIKSALETSKTLQDWIEVK